MLLLGGCMSAADRSMMPYLRSEPTPPALVLQPYTHGFSWQPVGLAVWRDGSIIWAHRTDKDMPLLLYSPMFRKEMPVEYFAAQVDPAKVDALFDRAFWRGYYLRPGEPAILWEGYGMPYPARIHMRGERFSFFTSTFDIVPPRAIMLTDGPPDRDTTFPPPERAGAVYADIRDRALDLIPTDRSLWRPIDEPRWRRVGKKK